MASVSLDRKEGVKLDIRKDNIKLSVTSTNSGEGNEILKATFDAEELVISFNSKYLIDIASEIEDKNLKIKLKDGTLKALYQDDADKNFLRHNANENLNFLILFFYLSFKNIGI